MFELVQIDGEAAGLYRRIRLAALKSDPSAFSSTYEREAQFGEEVWRQRASLDGRDRVGYFMMKAGAPCALVACLREEDDGHSRGRVVSMWVAPEARRCGLASRLLEAVRAWAESRGISTLRLFVTNNNHPAIALYKRAGFAETGKCEAYPNDPNLLEIEMERSTRVPIE
ncbi:MAG TPA: GNAT family N-acetyltransferase [Terracidiphilus sp.]|nr:GNAT family N-acetyltransferase [Terracidiphilus sp.]